ncbi:MULTISPECIES: glycosyltransferase [Flavobacterium]|uniref:N-acetyl-alpha-D-glucosaminyl L-malate synthase n=1 Tax=Flavobacterium panici TaxID=2654843 RepID=A0A9N8J6Z8_9FLAO|nr:MULTISPECIES: glycosyltransferase [Flavobacterium]UUF14880.1 glycosyltransferase [Flavobacterium panici]CAC9976408.1 N-acetyl-alpha-D-glucosaminyl L-malate synthase [Flavobacterium panici]
MKVLQIITSLSIGGAEKLIVDSVPLYQAKGIEMDVLSINNRKTPFWEKLEKNSNGKVSGLTSKSIYNPFLIFKIIPYLKKYDVVHLHLFPTLYWVVIAKCISFSKVKLVYTEHSTNNRRRDMVLFKFVDKIIYKKLQKIVCITLGVKNNLKEHLKFNKNMQVINNGIDTKKFNNVDNITDFKFFEKEDFKLIQVSSFRKQKDQATLIRSLKLLPEVVKLILVGDGPLIENNKVLAEELGIKERVVFLGNRYDIPELLKYSDVVILSSEWEGFGLAIVEGMASGKPVIASNIDGIKEIVKDHGLLFEKGNEKELEILVRKLLEDNDFYQKNARQCLLRSNDFSINKMIDQYIEIYKLVQ